MHISVSFSQTDTATSEFYKNLHETSGKHKWTRWLFNISLRSTVPVVDDSTEITIKKAPKLSKNPFYQYRGKPIQTVRVIVLDPFGGSVNQFYGTRPDFLERVGNRLHIATKEKVVRNLLLFKEGSTADPLRLSESERLLRLSPSIFDARIYIFKVGKTDSLDVLIVVQDKWSLISWSAFNLNAPDIGLRENNFLGIGHQYQQQIVWNLNDPYPAFHGRYGVYNFGKSYIQGNVYYTASPSLNLYGGSLNRPFYSPITVWAGGVGAMRSNNIVPATAEAPSYPVNYTQTEVWAARSFQVKQHGVSLVDARSSRFIIGAGIYTTTYNLRPAASLDYLNEQLFLINFGFSRRTYYRDRYLFRYGANEDIPEGIALEFIEGLQVRESNSALYYSGVKLSAGKHIDQLGYFSTSLGMGTSLDVKSIYSGVLNFGVFYFTDLWNVNRWKFRQFMRFNLIQGVNRAPNEQLNINGTQMYGFSSEILAAPSKAVLNLEFLMYTPYKWLGFQFAPVLLAGFATVGNDISMLYKPTVYQAYALGILIRNEYLIASTFQLSIGLYPFMPGSNDYTIKGNPISGYNVRATDYFITKPERIAYQ
ncbi:MAG: hypothetical protein WC760_08700 [Bacteroidia bacterium]